MVASRNHCKLFSGRVNDVCGACRMRLCGAFTFSRSLRGCGSHATTDAARSMRHQCHQGAVHGQSALFGFGGVTVRRKRAYFLLPQAVAQRSKDNVAELPGRAVEVELQLLVRAEALDGDAALDNLDFHFSQGNRHRTNQIGVLIPPCKELFDVRRCDHDLVHHPEFLPTNVPA